MMLGNIWTMRIPTHVSNGQVLGTPVKMDGFYTFLYMCSY